jgi:hypothetical protein
MSRWLWCLLVWGALGCRGSGSPSEEAEEKAAQASAAPDAGGDGARRAQRRPDGGSPDAGPFRYELEGVQRPDPGKGTCPPGTHRCCEGSCSPNKQCPGVACDPIPTMSE